jgi:hypothetical protein
MLNKYPFLENKDAGTLAQAIIDTVREPLLVLDKNLCVLAASRPFLLRQNPGSAPASSTHLPSNSKPVSRY